MQKDKGFWIGLSLVNLTAVALFGLLMRSKVIFSVPFLDYRNLLSAHSYLALSGWVGVALWTLLVYDVLPPQLAQKKQYRHLLGALQTSAAGMGLSFPFLGYHAVSVFFVLLYYTVTFVFGWAFLKDVKKGALPSFVRWLSIGAVLSLLFSSLGPLGISYIMLAGSGRSLLYRDLAYGFLHLQYNGFFTLAIFAIFFSWCIRRGIALPPAAKMFSIYLVLSVLPSLFLSLLWHNLVSLYLLAALGCILILISVGYFVPVFQHSLQQHFFRHPLAKLFWIASFISFVIKMIMTTGTIYPGLGDAVYGARPIIIGFMHLVFLAFVSFFILSFCIEQGYFRQSSGVARYPFYIFGAGVVVTELLLLMQGVAVLLQTNHPFYNQGLWAGAILLFTGAFMLMANFYRTRRKRVE